MRLIHLLKAEPTAIGTLAASVFPVLILLDAVRIDEQGIAAVVVAINTTIGFLVRLLVVPKPEAPARAAAADATAEAALTR